LRKPAPKKPGSDIRCNFTFRKIRNWQSLATPEFRGQCLHDGMFMKRLNFALKAAFLASIGRCDGYCRTGVQMHFYGITSNVAETLKTKYWLL